MRSCALLFILVELSSGLATPADAVLSQSTKTLTLPRVHSFRFGGQARETAAAAMPHIFKLRGRLLYLSARAAFAASAGSYAIQARLESTRPPRSNSPWLRSSRPVSSRAASSARSTLAGNISSTCHSFRRGSSVETSDGTLPAALKAWTWKNCQGILMPPLDRRRYRWLVLPNGLQVMVISDPSSTKAAAAMSVDAGAASDPKNLPGLAHFLEHMLFLGTSKYPAENAYKSYLAKHGGRSNASTAMDATTFQFEGALDIFSQFFVSPLLTESSTERELMAVDSEDSKNRTNDSRRLLQVLKALADPDHPYSKFSTGNAKTLRDDVPEGIDTRQELLAFLERHYSAPNMALVVLGKENLDVLEEWARTCFEEVRVSGLVRPTDDEADAASKEGPAEAAQTEETGDDRVKVESGSEASTALPTSMSGGGSVADELAETMRSPWQTPPAMTVDVQPLREMRRLMIQWPMPPVQRLWRNSPTRVLSHLMGHEGPGSLFAALQDQGLATSVSAGLRTSHEDFSLFQVDVGLTEEGEKRWRDVAGLVHAHARLVKELSQNDVHRVWKEARDMSAIYLRFQQEVSPYNAVTSLSRRLQLYPFQEALIAGGVLDPEIDHDLFSAFADYLKPENTLTWRVWKRNQDEDSRDGVKEEEQSGAGQARSTESTAEPEAQELQERWYGVKYGAAPTPPELIRAWGSPNDRLDSALGIPGPNVFIPDDFSLVCDRKDYSTGTIKDSGSGPNGEGSGNASANLNVHVINVNEEAVGKGGGRCEGGGVIDEGGEGTSSVDIAGPRLRSSGGERVSLGEPQRGVLKAPDLLREDTDCREGVEKDGHLWHRLDTSFRQPRAYAQIVLGTPVVREQGAQASVHAGIMADVLSTVLAQRTYDASLAGLGWKVAPHPCGYVLQVSGFSQKIEPLLQEVAEAFLDPEAAAGGPKAFAKQFDLAKERAVRRARSWSMNRPDNIAYYYSSKALEFPRDLELDPGHLKASQAATLEGCLSLHKEALSRIFPVGLVYGNASPDDARRMWRTVTKRLHDSGCQVLPEEAYPRSLVGVLPMGKRVNVRADVPNQDDENSAAVAYWQLGERNERKFATLVLLGQMMREPCFTELRTKQQIGYIVSSGLHSHGRGGRQLGFSVDALSKTMGPDEICERIDAFVPWFRETVASMSQEEFDTHVQSLITKRLEPPKKATDEFSRIRNEIFPGDLKWNRAAALAEMLASVKREDVLELIDRELLADDTSKRMNVLVYGKDRTRPSPSPDTSSEEKNARTIELVPETLREFVASLPMYDTTITPQQAVASDSRP